MTLTETWLVVAVGTAGGAGAELLHWWGLNKQSVLPEYARKVRYWLVTALMALAGGLIAWLYFGSHAEGILAFHVGASTPLLLQKLVTVLPEQSGVKGGGPTMRRFFQW